MGWREELNFIIGGSEVFSPFGIASFSMLRSHFPFVFAQTSVAKCQQPEICIGRLTPDVFGMTLCLERVQVTRPNGNACLLVILNA